MRTHKQVVAEQEHGKLLARLDERVAATWARDRADAARWRYVRDNLVSQTGPKFPDFYGWEIDAHGDGDFTENIDRRIVEQQS